MTDQTQAVAIVAEIEDGIEMPHLSASGRPRTSAYANLDKLEVGQSIFVAGKKLSTVKIYLSSAVTKSLRDQNRQFIAAEAEKAGVAGVRIWRKADKAAAE